MANKNNEKRDSAKDCMDSHEGTEIDAQARACLMELSTDDDTASDDLADDGKCVDRESGIDPADDLPEMDLIMRNIYDL